MDTTNLAHRQQLLIYRMPQLAPAFSNKTARVKQVVYRRDRAEVLLFVEQHGEISARALSAKCSELSAWRTTSRSCALNAWWLGGLSMDTFIEGYRHRYNVACETFRAPQMDLTPTSWLSGSAASLRSSWYTRLRTCSPTSPRPF